VAIDWSGAKGKRHKGIAVAQARSGDAAPSLVRPGHVWSRCEILDWVLSRCAEEPTLVGMDCSFAPPLAERGSYLPGEPGVPATGKAFWAYVDRVCDDDDLGASSLLEDLHRRHFYFGAADGVKRDFLHHRVCEHAFNASGGGKASTLYDAIGAAQVAKASFAAMRLLHRIDGRLAIWPFDPLPPRGSVIVEIYTRAFIRLAGLSDRKVRTREALEAALIALGSRNARLKHVPTDHETDVLIAAAAMRAICGIDTYWRPKGLTRQIAKTEGWTFGVA
jgi:hypothetical protein